MREAALLLRRQTHTWCLWELVQVPLGPLSPPGWSGCPASSCTQLASCVPTRQPWLWGQLEHY